MIVEYHRPETLERALELLARSQPRTLPMGGGTVISRSQGDDFAVVDLQAVGLNTLEREGQLLGIGATVTLQQMVEYKGWPEGLRNALLESLDKEMALNLRNTATLGGTLVSTDGRSPLVTALLALDPRVEWTAYAAFEAYSAQDPKGVESTPLGDFLLLRKEFLVGKLITGLRLPLNQTLRFAQVARAPQDRPVVCAAVARWPSGRTRVTLGGWGNAPLLAMDGPEPAGAMASAREAYRSAGDQWASAEYRMDVAGNLVKRLALDFAGVAIVPDSEPAAE